MTKNKKSEKNNNIFLIVLFVIIIVLVLFFPTIYEYVESLKLPRISNSQNINKEATKEVDEELLEEIHYPLMRNSIYDSNTYYSLDKFTIENMSNNDILYNAFLDIYEGNMTSFNGTGSCTSISKQFNQDYIELRIKNILGKNINYTLEDFNVPVGAETDYVGNWYYDSTNSRFIYNGLCNSNVSETKYYNLEQFIKAEYDNKDIVVYYYVGFAKVENNNYIIYSDANMTKDLTTGSFNNIEELDSIFEKLDNKNKGIYKYTFKNPLCSYDEYCLYEGKWIDEL